MTKAELASLQKEHDTLTEEKAELEKEYSDLQKKRMKLTT